TRPRLSPTTTRALKLKRRPPLTTAAQRRILTTRSSRPSCRCSRSRSRSRAMVCYSRRLGQILQPEPPVGQVCNLPEQEAGYKPAPGSELQAALAGGVGQGLDPAVIPVVAAVEGGLGDAGGLGLLGQRTADDHRRL